MSRQKEKRCMGEEGERARLHERPGICASQCRELSQPTERLSRPDEASALMLEGRGPGKVVRRAMTNAEPVLLKDSSA